MIRQEKEGKHQQAKRLLRQTQQLPSIDPHDPAFRRLMYIRYADDMLLGFIGTREEDDGAVLLLRRAKMLAVHGKLEEATEQECMLAQMISKISREAMRLAYSCLKPSQAFDRPWARRKHSHQREPSSF